MAESNYTFGCGKFLPGYGPGNFVDFIPPNSTGDPVDPPDDPIFECVPVMPIESSELKEIDGAIVQVVTVEFPQECKQVNGPDPIEVNLASFLNAGVGYLNTIPGKIKDVDAAVAQLANFNIGCGGPNGCPSIVVEKTNVINAPGVELRPSLPTPDPPIPLLPDEELLYSIKIDDQQGLIAELVVNYGDGNQQTIIYDGINDPQITVSYDTTGAYTVSVDAFSVNNLLLASDSVDIIVEEPFSEVTIGITPPSQIIVGQSALISIELTPDGIADELVVYFGDGQQQTQTGFSSPVSVNHVYNTVGDFIISVEALLSGEVLSQSEKAITVDQGSVVITMDVNPEKPTYNVEEDITFSISVDPKPTTTFYNWYIDNIDAVYPEQQITAFTINNQTEINTYQSSTLEVTTTNVVGEFEIKCIVGNSSGQLGEVVRTLVVEDD